MSKRMTKAGFKAYLKRTNRTARCNSSGRCVLANYLRTELGYRDPGVCDGYADCVGQNHRAARPLPYWARVVMNEFDGLENVLLTSVVRAAQYRKPLLAVL